MTAPAPATSGKLQTLLAKRPAESATAAAGAVGLLLASILDGNESLETALIVILAALPATVSFLHDLGRRPRQRGVAALEDEVTQLGERAARRARIGDSLWTDDVRAMEALSPLIGSLRPPPAGPPKTDGAGAGESGN